MSYVHDDQYGSLLGRGVRDRAVLLGCSCGVSEVSILGEYLQRVKTERDEAVKLLRSLRSNIAVADFPVPDWNLLDRTDDFLSRYDYRMTTMKPDLAAELALVVQRAENAEAALAYAASTGDECAIEVEADKDAERYRWLRDATGWSIQQWLGLSGVWTEYLSGKNLDAAIDAAMGESHE